jgi:isoleucyl-tRNA synthetase
VEVIGSVAELTARTGQDQSALDLHRPYVDEITWPDGNGGTMRRVPEVLDVWFDSGAMPFAQWHWPFENEALAKRQFPADFICEGLDQTRGWFYSLHAIAALVTGEAAYRSCFVTGLLLAEDGRKMSKSLGNTVDPWEAVELGGADALRWFLTVTNNPSGGMRFSAEGVREVSRKILDTLRNLWSFFARYANLDGWTGGEAPPPASRPLMDRWILSRLESLVAAATKDLDALEISRAGRAVEEFVLDDLSNWYVRRNRERFWAKGMEADKRAAYDTLATCLDTVVRLMAPFAPFLTERVWRALAAARPDAAESVHLAPWPESHPERIEADLERRMDDARRLVRLGRAGRNRANVKTRQPLRRMRMSGPVGAGDFGELMDVVADELNVKTVEPGDTAALSLSAKARFDVLGPRFGKEMKNVAAAIAKLDSARIAELERRGTTDVRVGEATHAVRREEVVVSHEDPAGWVLEREAGWSVALDLDVDEDLKAEGFARELINKIQFMRRKADFAVTDRIEVFFEGTDLLRVAMARHEDLIRRETQSDRILPGRGAGETQEEWTINGEPAFLCLRRI